MSTSAPVSRPRARLNAIVAALLAFVLAVAGIIATSTDASAAAKGYGFGTWSSSDQFFGSFRLSAGSNTFIFCVEPGVTLPTGTTSSLGFRNSVEGTSGNILAGVSYLIDTYGSTTNNNQAAALSFAIKDLINHNALIANGWYETADLEGHIHYKMSQFVGDGANLSYIKSRARQFVNEAKTIVPSTNSNGTGSFIFNVDSEDNYKGTLRVNVNPANATGTVTLTNGVFADTGLKTRSGVRNGQVFNIRGIPPVSNPKSYKISASGTFQAEGSGYAANVRVYETPGGQKTIGYGSKPTTTFSFSGTDPFLRAGEFLPALSTTATAYVQEGQPFRDQVTFFTVADSDDVNNSWAQTEGGSYYPVMAEGTLYGPFAERPTVADEAPADAPVAATATVTTTTAVGPGTYTVDAGTALQSGYYTWVWEIDQAKQSLATQGFIPADWVYRDKFGLTAETTVVPMKPEAVSQVNKEWAAPGETVQDSLTVTNTNGAWLAGTEATFEGTAYGLPHGQNITPSATVPADAVALHTETLTFTEPGTKYSEEVTVPDDTGAVVWVWRFVRANQDEPNMFASGWAWADQFGLPTETTRVQMVPTITTQADQLPDGSFDDQVTISLGGGHWIEDTSIVARGTLYGPLANNPAVSDDVPADAPVANTATLVFTEQGTQTTDTSFRPTEAGHYTWVWTIDASDQGAGTQQALPDGYRFADQYGLENETSIREMELGVTTAVTKPNVALGEPSIDTMTVEVTNGEWIQRDGENIPVRFKGTLYHSPVYPTQSATVPDDASAIDTVYFEASAPGTYELPAGRGETHRSGFLTWVWEIADADQSAELAGMTAEWVDDYGVPSETQVLLVPNVTSVAMPGAKFGEDIYDVAYITGTLPYNGAELTFEAYKIPMVKDASGKWVIDYPEPQDGTGDDDEGSDGEGEPDTDGNVTFEEGGDDAPEVPESWEWVVNEENLVGDNLDNGEIVTEPGEYKSPEFAHTEYSKVLWIETLWSVPTDAGEERQAIHRGLAGVKSETTFMLDVKTYAMSDNGARKGIEHGVDTWDTATITGYVPENGKLVFEGYVVPTESKTPLAEACTADNLAWTSPAIDLDGGLYPEEAPLELESDHHQYNPSVDSTLYWVAVVYDEVDREVARGDCGDADETVGLKGAKLETTAGPIALGAGAAVLAAVAAVFFIVAYRRRQVA